MPVFEIEKDGQVFEVDAPDQATALQAFGSYQPPATPQAATPPHAPAPGNLFYDDGKGISVEVETGAPVADEEPETPAPSIRERIADYGLTALNLGLRAINPMAGAMIPDARAETAIEGAKSGAMLGGKNEIASGIAALGALVRGGSYGDQFVKNLRHLDAEDDAMRAEHPAAWNTGAAVGAVGSGVAAPLAAPQLASGSLGVRALANAGMGGLSGALATDGGMEERAGGAAVGAALGGALPLAGAGIGRGVRAGLQATARPVEGVSGRAGAVLSEVFDPASAQRLMELGPDAMLVDASPSMMGVAQGVVTRPGAGKDTVVRALRERAAGANSRLSDDVAGALGPEPTPAALEAGFETSRRAMDPLYGQAVQGQSMNPLGFLGRIDRELDSAKGGAARALREARDFFLTPDGQPDTTARGLLNARGALDGLYARLEGDGQARAMISRLRQALDDELKQLPGIRRLDGANSALHAQSRALDEGQRALDSGRTAVRPVELEANWQTMIPAEQRAFRAGTRAEIGRLVGTKANDLTALKQAVKGEGDWNRDRLAQIFGQDEAERVIGAVDREAAFDDAYRRLVQNSETASRQGGAEFLKPANPPGMDTPQTALGVGIQASKKLARSVIGDRNRRMSDALAAELGPILTAQGARRDALIQQLLSGETRVAGRRLSADQTRRLAEALLRPGAQGAVGSPSASPGSDGRSRTTEAPLLQ